jgi:hypothetical protein
MIMLKFAIVLLGALLIMAALADRAVRIQTIRQRLPTNSITAQILAFFPGAFLRWRGGTTYSVSASTNAKAWHTPVQSAFGRKADMAIVRLGPGRGNVFTFPFFSSLLLTPWRTQRSLPLYVA